MLLVLAAAGPAWADDAVTFADVIAAVPKAPAAQISGHEIGAADALIAAAGGWPNPSIRVETNRLTARMVVGATVPLPVFGTVGAARREASARAKVTRTEAELALRELWHRAALAWLALARADGEIAAGLETAKQAAELERIARGKLDAGTGAEVDVTTARAARARADLAVVGARHAQGSAAADLAAVLGWDPTRLVHAGGELPVGSPTAIDALRAGLARHPDRVAGVTKVAAADATVAEIRTHARPGLAIDAQASFDDPTQPGTDVLVGLTLELPLFAKIGSRARSARASAAAERARLAVTETQLSGSLVASYQRWQAASDRLAGLVKDVVPLQEKATALSELAYREGARELVTAVAAERDLATVRAEVNAARIDAAASWIELQLAAGGDVGAH